jgi:hypothetical protein
MQLPGREIGASQSASPSPSLVVPSPLSGAAQGYGQPRNSSVLVTVELSFQPTELDAANLLGANAVNTTDCAAAMALQGLHGMFPTGVAPPLSPSQSPVPSRSPTVPDTRRNTSMLDAAFTLALPSVRGFRAQLDAALHELSLSLTQGKAIDQLRPVALIAHGSDEPDTMDMGEAWPEHPLRRRRLDADPSSGEYFNGLALELVRLEDAIAFRAMTGGYFVPSPTPTHGTSRVVTPAFTQGQFRISASPSSVPPNASENWSVVPTMSSSQAMGGDGFVVLETKAQSSVSVAFTVGLSLGILCAALATGLVVVILRRRQATARRQWRRRAEERGKGLAKDVTTGATGRQGSKDDGDVSADRDTEERREKHQVSLISKRVRDAVARRNPPALVAPVPRRITSLLRTFRLSPVVITPPCISAFPLATADIPASATSTGQKEKGDLTIANPAMVKLSQWSVRKERMGTNVSDSVVVPMETDQMVPVAADVSIPEEGAETALSLAPMAEDQDESAVADAWGSHVNRAKEQQLLPLVGSFHAKALGCPLAVHAASCIGSIAPETTDLSASLPPAPSFSSFDAPPPALSRSATCPSSHILGPTSVVPPPALAQLVKASVSQSMRLHRVSSQPRVVRPLSGVIARVPAIPLPPSAKAAASGAAMLGATLEWVPSKHAYVLFRDPSATGLGPTGLSASTPQPSNAHRLDFVIAKGAADLVLERLQKIPASAALQDGCCAVNVAKADNHMCTRPCSSESDSDRSSFDFLRQPALREDSRSSMSSGEFSLVQHSEDGADVPPLPCLD